MQENVICHNLSDITEAECWLSGRHKAAEEGRTAAQEGSLQGGQSTKEGGAKVFCGHKAYWQALWWRWW